MREIRQSLSGGCQCGRIRYHADTRLDNAHLCHCRMCQKAVGNLFAALVAVPNEALHWTRGEPAAFRSSEHVERGFCRDCGTPLFFRNLAGDRINLTIGSLDKPGEIPPLSQMGTESRLPCFAGLPALRDEGETGDDEDADWAEAIRRSNRQHPDHDTDEWQPS